MHVEVIGRGPRVVLVHGSLSGPAIWSATRELAERWTLEVVARPGFAPNEPVDRIDFATDAPLVAAQLREGAHLVGFSYGGVVSLLAAAARPEAVRSLTVVEPPAFALARGREPVDRLVRALEDHWRGGPSDPRTFAEQFLRLVGSATALPDPLPAELEQSARALRTERLPSEADIPLAHVRAQPFPKLVVSGAHHPAFESVCDVLERELDAERAVVAGAGHSIPRAGEPFNRVLEDFLTRAFTGSDPVKRA